MKPRIETPAYNFCTLLKFMDTGLQEFDDRELRVSVLFQRFASGNMFMIRILKHIRFPH